jgi:hypothetical protein
LRPPLNLSIQRRRRRPWLAIGASVLVHALAATIAWVEGWVPTLPHRPPQMIVLAPGQGPEQVEMRYQTGRRTDGKTGRDRLAEKLSGVPTPPRRPAAPLPRAEPEPPPAARPDTGTTPERRPARPLIGRIGPGLAEGRLWVRPLPLPPKELAQRLSKDHAKLVDSAVTAIVQGYLDSIAADPTARNTGLPSWTKEIAGKKFGLDSKNIYIAGLKIPAAVLALLPIPAGNIDQNKAYNHMMDLRTDLQYAAQRSANLEEFKQTIRDMRLRKEREREFERNQRTAPEAGQPGSRAAGQEDDKPADKPADEPQAYP